MRKRLLALALILPLAGGCATKRDVRDLQTEIATMRAQQERLLRELQEQNASIMDSMSVQGVRMRGDFANQLIDIERQLVQIQELSGQQQQVLGQLREDVRRREEAQRQQQAALDAAADLGDPNELFESAEGALQRGSLSSAKLAFTDFVNAFPDHERAPAAHLFLGGILAQEDSLEAALEQYSRILEHHPNATEAAQALFKAAEIERDRGNTDRARSLFNQLTAAYPTSPEAGVARDELRRLR